MGSADELAFGVLGLLAMLLGFEFAFVTSLSLLSEAMPEARGATLALGNAVATTTRAAGMVIGGVLYGLYGITGTAVFSAAAAVAALGCFAAGGPIGRADAR